MNAMPAIALREREDEISYRPGKAFKKAKKKAKVINLVPRRDDSGKLTLAEQETMILDHRTKGRSLAHSILRRWHSRLDPQEVESVVDLSLCETVKRFNKKKGASFITFFFYHLRGNLIRAVSAAASMNYLPLPDFDTLDAGSDGHGTQRRLANAMEIADSLCNHEHVSPDEALLKKEIAKISTEACTKLDPLEREVIYRIYVLEQQLMDIAQMLGYSRCHISRVKRKALETLHTELATTVKPEGAPDKPNFGDEEKETPRRTVLRRKIRARKVRTSDLTEISALA